MKNGIENLEENLFVRFVGIAHEAKAARFWGGRRTAPLIGQSLQWTGSGLVRLQRSGMTSTPAKGSKQTSAARSGRL